MAISGKVTASTVAAALTTVVAGIVAPHVFPHGTPSDVAGLFEGAVAAGVTFVSGYMARHGIAVPTYVEQAAADFGMPFTSIPDAPEDLAPVAPVAPSVQVDPAVVRAALAVTPDAAAYAPIPPATVAPVAVPVAQPLP